MMETSNPISRRYELQAQAIAIRLPALAADTRLPITVEAKKRATEEAE